MSPILKLEVEWVSGSGAFTDISAHLLKSPGVTITRGRTGSDRRTSGGTMTLTLRNDSGTYTPELNANVRRGKRVRLTATVNGTPKVRFTGYVNQWSVGSIRKGAGSRCTLACIDGQAFFNAPMGPTAREVLESYGCIAYWPMTETDGTVFSEVMGKGFPNLVARHLSTGGTLDAGQGTPLPTDPAQVVKFSPASTTSGWYLEAERPANFGTAWTLGAWMSGGATGYYSALTIQQGDIWANLMMTVTGSVAASESMHDAAWVFRGGAAGIGGDPSTDSNRVAMLSTSTSVIQIYPDIHSATSARAYWAIPYSAGVLRVGWADDPARLSTGSMGHVFVLDHDASAAEMAALASALEAAVLNADARIAQWYGWAGEPQTVVTLGTAAAIVQPGTDGQVPAELAQTTAEALGARHLFNRDGQPLWIGADYRPTPVTIQPGWVDAEDFAFATTPDQYVSKVDASLPSGGSYTYAKDNPEIRNPDSITGAAANDYVTKAVAQWIANTADGGGRVPQVTLHLDRRTPAEQATLADLDVASRLTLDSLPETLPTSLAVVGEGYTETFTDTWDQTWNLSKDSSLIIVGTSLVGGTDILSPL